MLNVKKLGINNILILAIIILIIACSTCVFYTVSSETVSAETTSDSLLSFNQLLNKDTINLSPYDFSIDNNYNLTINNYKNSGSTSWFQIFNGTGLKNHKFYFKFNSKNGLLMFNANFGTSYLTSQVLDSGDTDNVIFYIRLGTGEASELKSTIQLIDLTQMYGVGNEPTLEECEKIFITTYNYTNSYYVSNENFYYYSQGVNSVNKSLTIGEAVSDWVNNTYNLDASEFVKNDNGTIAWTKGNIATNTNYSLLANDTITITMEIGGSPDSNNLIIGQLNENGNFEQLLSVDYSDWNYSAPGGLIGVYSGSVSFKLKYNTNQIIFNSTGNILICKKIEFTTYNYDNQLLNAFKQGAESIDTSYYYQKGVSDGIKQGAAQGTAWGNSWEFISSCFNGIGDILSIEILPNLPLYTFIAIPLLLGLIVLIYKLIGSGG